MKRTGDFCALSYVWGPPHNRSDGSRVKIPYTTRYDREVRRKHEQHTWVDIIAHLGNEAAKQDVLQCMGGI